MPELGSLGSVRGALSNERPYRECGNSDYADSVVAVGAIESSMTHISGFERSQILLLPKAIDDYVDNGLAGVLDIVAVSVRRLAGMLYRYHIKLV